MLFTCADHLLLASMFAAGGRQGGPLHRELSTATVGIVGIGSIGRETARRAASFGMRVLGCNRTVPTDDDSPPGFSEPVYPLHRLGEMAGKCDYLCLTVALTRETEGLLDAQTLAQCKPGCVVLNVARAQLCDEVALYDALACGHLGGALLDAWWRYPTAAEPNPRPSHQPFHELPPDRMMMTPHASCWSAEMLDRRWVGIAANVRAALAGEVKQLTNVVRCARGAGGGPP